MLCVSLISIAVVAIVLIAILQRVKTMRRLDIISAVVNFAYVCGLFRLLTAIGLNKRAKVVEVTASNGAKLMTDPNFFAVEEVLSLQARKDDVYVATYHRAGTTWMQEIVWLICNDVDVRAARKKDIRLRSPFLEIVDVPATGIAGLQTIEQWPVNKQRIMKTHMPFPLLPLEVQSMSKGKIIYVARNPKDVCVSQYHYARAFKRMPKPGMWEEFLSKFCRGKLMWGDWFDHNIKYWEEHKKDSNRIHFVTYEGLKKSLREEIASVAKFLGRILTEKELDTLTDHCSFDSMSRNEMTNYSKAERSGLDFKVSKFMRKGIVGDWKNHFTSDQSADFDELYKRRMEGTGLDFEFELRR